MSWAPAAGIQWPMAEGRRYTPGPAPHGALRAHLVSRQRSDVVGWAPAPERRGLRSERGEIAAMCVARTAAATEVGGGGRDTGLAWVAACRHRATRRLR